MKALIPWLLVFQKVVVVLWLAMLSSFLDDTLLVHIACVVGIFVSGASELIQRHLGDIGLMPPQDILEAIDFQAFSCVKQAKYKEDQKTFAKRIVISFRKNLFCFVFITQITLGPGLWRILFLCMKCPIYP